MRIAPYVTVHPVHKFSVAIDGPHNPIPTPNHRPSLWALYDDLQRREAATRQPGHQDGAITRNGLAVFRALISFENRTTGLCDPSYESVAARAAISVASVHRGLRALKRAKVVDWTSRLVRIAGPLGGFLMRQISNFYRFCFAPPWRRRPAPGPEPGTWGDHPNEGDSHERMNAALSSSPAVTSTTISQAAAIQERNDDGGNPMAAALARIARLRPVMRCEAVRARFLRRRGEGAV